MTDPIEQIQDALTESRSLVQPDKTPLDMAEVLRVGEQVARQLNREELERQIRCVQLYGHGYLLNHGGEQISLNPKDVTVVLPATRHMDDCDLHNALHLAEQKLEWAVKRIDDLEDVVESLVLGDVFAERDEARAEVQVLQDRIAKIRQYGEDMKQWCSPYGVALRYGTELVEFIDWLCLSGAASSEERS